MNRAYPLIVLILIITSCNTSEEIDFRVGYLPNLEYTLSQGQISNNHIEYRGSEEFLESLKKGGIQNPTITKDSSLFKSISITGALEGDEFPIDVEILESNNPTLVRGTRFYGKIADGENKIDSITSMSMTEENKRTVLPLLQSLINQIKYPERKIAVGESFEQRNPIALNIADVTVEIEIKSIYTLNRVENGKGVFDLDQVYTVKSASKDYEINLGGKGVGEIEYDIEKQFFTKFLLESEMDLNAELEIFSIQLQTKSITNQNTEVNKPNV